MACFTVPAVQAIATTIAMKAAKSSEMKMTEAERTEKLPLSKKLGWLNGMLWGGSGLLALEHIWHGEITPVFPFLTGDITEALAEMATTGVIMSAAVTAVWGGMVLLSNTLEKRAKAAEKTAEELR